MMGVEVNAERREERREEERLRMSDFREEIRQGREEGRR